TDYPYPESIWAATQAGVALVPPVLERRGPDGTWQTVLADASFPAGLPRMMLLELTGKLGGPAWVLRLRTNMHVYWDQVFVVPLRERIAAGKQPAGFRTTCLEVSAARLDVLGCMQEYSPDGRLPTLFDYDRRDRVPVSRLSGQLTRLGDVTELLQDRDDR